MTEHSITSLEGIPVPAVCVHDDGLEHRSDGTLPCPLGDVEGGSVLTGKTICIDLDGVIHSYRSGWNGGELADPPEPGAEVFLRWLLAARAEPVIFTTRGDTDAGIGRVRRWLTDNGLPVLPVTATKPPYAVAFIDDRAIPYRPGSGAWGAVARRLVHLVAEGTRAIPPAEQEPLLGYASTATLLDELDARLDVARFDGPGLYHIGGTAPDDVSPMSDQARHEWRLATARAQLTNARSSLTAAELAYRPVDDR